MPASMEEQSAIVGISTHLAVEALAALVRLGHEDMIDGIKDKALASAVRDASKAGSELDSDAISDYARKHVAPVIAAALMLGRDQMQNSN